MVDRVPLAWDPRRATPMPSGLWLPPGAALAQSVRRATGNRISPTGSRTGLGGSASASASTAGAAASPALDSSLMTSAATRRRRRRCWLGRSLTAKGFSSNADPMTSGLSDQHWMLPMKSRSPERSEASPKRKPRAKPGPAVADDPPVLVIARATHPGRRVCFVGEQHRRVDEIAVFLRGDRVLQLARIARDLDAVAGEDLLGARGRRHQQRARDETVRRVGMTRGHDRVPFCSVRSLSVLHPAVVGFSWELLPRDGWCSGNDSHEHLRREVIVSGPVSCKKPYLIRIVLISLAYRSGPWPGLPGRPGARRLGAAGTGRWAEPSRGRSG